MKILALDIGCKMGWAIGLGVGDVVSGTKEFRNGRHEGGGMRWLQFREWLAHMHDKHGPLDAIFYEEVRRHEGVDAAHAYGGFQAHLAAWCEASSVPYQGVPVGTIKKAATGKGNAGKAVMIAAMRARGYQPGDDNEADALALLICQDQRQDSEINAKVAAAVDQATAEAKAVKAAKSARKRAA